ncbi:unnamed protein product [Clavelina lepadiformis]|uniref:Tyrosine-protein kinase catalytic domain-containing protein n=1 Tax=Clavelina lepadiformis TaxID=159417 RepID=A0ABP0F3K6_CLALP
MSSILFYTEEITLYSCIPKNGGCLLLGKSKWWYGYCSDGSLKRADCSAVKRWGPPYNPDDTVGCRVEIEYVEESKHNIKIYFSKDHAEFNGPVIISDQSEKAQAYCILEFKGPKTLATYSALRIVAGEDGILAHGGSGNYYHGFDENDAPVTVGVYDQGWQDIFIKQKHEMIQRKPNPYLAQVYGVATLPYGVALIMEPMRGGSVFDLLHGCHGNTYRVPIIPTFLLLRMCAEIATGMASLLIHTAGQIEQISTRNMFLSESLNCKLCPTFYDHVGNIRPSTAQQLLVLKLGKIIYELILRQVPGETLSAASELVSAVNAYIDTLRDERSVNIHKYLRDVMISCLASHEQRPSIKQVRDSLALKLSTEQNVSEMQHAVADISESMGLKWIPFTAECVALGQISSARR